MTSAIIPFSTITLKADPSGASDKFIDNDSINAGSVRVHNSGTIEAFVAFGGAMATEQSLPIPPKESLILFKDCGVDTVSAVTESGTATIRFTAIEEKNGSDAMGGLEMVSVLKDAMGNQELIDAAVKKISDATDRLNTKKDEASEAAKTIVTAKMETAKLEKAKSDFEIVVQAHNDNVAAFNLAAEKTNEDIESKKIEAKTDYDNQCAVLSEIQKNINADKTALDSGRADIQMRENVLANNISAFAQDKANLEIAKGELADKQAVYDEAIAKFEARKKKLAEATKED